MKDETDAIVAWLRDTNAIQRDVVKTAAAKTDVVAEHDLSGGLTGLLNLLRSDAPIPRPVRDALAIALDPYGGSLLQLKKRARRAPGRPSTESSVKDAARRAYTVVREEPAAEEAKNAIEKLRPIRANGTIQKATKKEIVHKLGVPKTEHYRRVSEAKALKSR
jgi:ribosomal protein S20